MGSDYLLEMIHITKDFPGVRALDGASLQVKAGEVHIILGENGAGKSTLMKILSGAYPLEKGEIRINGEPVKIRNPKDAEKLGISTIYQEFNLVPSLTVAQNIFLNREFMKESVPWQIDHKRMEQEAEKLLSKLKVAVDVRKPVRELGIAEQQMVEIAKALSLNCRILIMDEPTAALTEQETDNLFNIIRDIKKQGVAVIYISHRIEEFLKIGDTITVMRDGKTLATGPIHAYTLEELIRIMVGREINDQFPKESVPPGDVRLEVKHLTSPGLFSDVSFHVSAGEILGIAGLMGAGRTEVARAIFGLDPFAHGEIYVDGKKVEIRSPQDAIKAGIGFLTENRRDEGLVLPLSVCENITLPSLDKFHRFLRIDKKEEKLTVKSYIDDLKIHCHSEKQIVATLSGGNQQKAVLAKWLLSGSRVLILDEPTRGIDVGAKVEVYNLMNRLTKQGAAIVMISSELPEIIGMSDRVIVLWRGRVAGELSREELSQEKIMMLATTGGKAAYEG